MSIAGVVTRAQSARDEALQDEVHSTRTAALLGVALGACFLVCFATGLVSHLIQHPTGWFRWPPRPVGLYRATQGIHVATGLATIPLLLAKLWSVFPHLFRWPPVTSVAHAVERIMLVPLVCGAVFMLFSGAANIAQFYPWHFAFPVAHYWVAWITIGALVAHTGAKLATTRDALRHPPAPGTAMDGSAMSRRSYLTLAGASAAAVTLTTVGQTYWPLRRLVLFGPRRPDIGPQGLPVNALATADIRAAGRDPAYRLRVIGDVPTPLELGIDDLAAMTQHETRLPIACVEGWSATADWRGVPVRDLLARAGVRADDVVEVTVHSLQRGGSYGHSRLSNAQARDRDTLVALEVNGETLHPDHGYPCRLIGPNRPGVQQTKWLRDLTVTRL
ncbi:MAG TPA: molybdopterin-dependent oxidoreductase [Acidimicrobiales bacterium]|nr:molybdopterin-dependent oxidoreductase [Acidimicrobiales bacterium]